MKILKTLLAFAIASTLNISCKKTETEIVTKSNETKTIASDAKLATTSFKIDGMTCAVGCAKTIEKGLSETAGVKSATVDFDKKTAKVEYDSNTQSPEKIIEIVEKTGDGLTYKVSNVTNSKDKAMLFQ
jgi:periplasmic mercuric ion binding protein